MAHLIDSMAYTGQTPWHGLGNVLPPQQSLDVWLQAAGMDSSGSRSNPLACENILFSTLILSMQRRIRAEVDTYLAHILSR